MSLASSSWVSPASLRARRIQDTDLEFFVSLFESFGEFRIRLLSFCDVLLDVAHRSILVSFQILLTVSFSPSDFSGIGPLRLLGIAVRYDEHVPTREEAKEPIG